MTYQGPNQPRDMWWPDVATIKGAQRGIEQGVAAVGLAAAGTALVVILRWVGAWAWVDVAILLAAAYGIQLRSRVAAVFGLVWHVFGMVLKMIAVNQKGKTALAIGLLFLVYLINGVRGTFAYRRLRVAEAKTASDPST
ncbi:MAG: hypothetical protein HY905_13250 [Deltaproteobacteria bacterium]|nr:hypothetical protein [Deltaproteobacteria bacterium]